MNELTNENPDEFTILLQNHFGKELTTSELSLFSLICRRTRLDPFIGQIRPIKRRNKQVDGSYKEVMVIQVGIDGFRSIAESTQCYCPGKEPTYVYDENKRIVSATAYIKKMTSDGTWHEVSATAFMNEFRPKYGNFWDNMPHVMIAKCAEAQAIRKAFPSKTSQIYAPEEMHQSAPPPQEPAKEDTILIEEKRAAKNTSTAFLSPMDQLKEHLHLDEISTERLDEWIKMRAETKGYSTDTIIALCLETPVSIEKFKRTYSTWLVDLYASEAAESHSAV